MKPSIKKIPVISKPMSIFIVICIVVCVSILAYITISILSSQWVFSNSINQIKEMTKMLVSSNNIGLFALFKNTSGGLDQFIENINSHLENLSLLVKLQQDMSSSNIANLVYTFISTILLIVAIYFVRDIEEKHLAINKNVKKQREKVAAFPRLIEATSMFFLHIQQLDYIGLFLCQEKLFAGDGDLSNSLIVRVRDNFDDIDILISHNSEDIPAYIANEVIDVLQWFEQRLVIAWNYKNIDDSVKNELSTRINGMVETIMGKCDLNNDSL